MKSSRVALDLILEVHSSLFSALSLPVKPTPPPCRYSREHAHTLNSQSISIKSGNGWLRLSPARRQALSYPFNSAEQRVDFQAVILGYRDLVVYDIWAAALGKLEDAEDGPWREKGYGLIKMMCERWPRDWRVSPPQISNASFSILVSDLSAHLPRCKERNWFEEKGREKRLLFPFWSLPSRYICLDARRGNGSRGRAGR
jgi:hypothetical protein